MENARGGRGPSPQTLTDLVQEGCNGFVTVVGGGPGGSRGVPTRGVPGGSEGRELGAGGTGTWLCVGPFGVGEGHSINPLPGF